MNLIVFNLILLEIKITFCKNSYFFLNHNYNKIVRSDWLSTALILALIDQFNRTVRVTPK